MMDRRTFLHALSAAGLSAVSLRSGRVSAPAGPPGDVNSVIVIGAGIVGASIAYNLSKRGCDVLILDKSGPAAQASGNSFAWINASWYDQPDSYFALRTASLNEYHRLSAELDFPLHWGGSLEWYHTEEARSEMAAGIERVQQLGAPTWLIDKAQTAAIEPELNIVGDMDVAWCSRDGAIDPAATTKAMVDAVVDHGGRAIFPSEVTGIRKTGGKIEVSAGMFSFEADLIVVAAGTGANEVASMAGIDTDIVLPATPGIIVTTRAMPSLLNTISYTSDSHFHQLPNGRVIVGEKAGPPDTAEHAALIGDRPNAYPSDELARQHATRVLATAGKYVPELTNAEVASVGVGWRPLPVDGLPVVGHVPTDSQVYMASMHSGVTLAPIIGHLAAMEILDGVRVDALADFRIARLTS